MPSLSASSSRLFDCRPQKWIQSFLRGYQTTQIVSGVLIAKHAPSEAPRLPLHRFRFDSAHSDVLCRPVQDYKPFLTWRRLRRFPLPLPSFHIRHCGIYETVRTSVVDWLGGRMPQGYYSSQVLPNSKYSIGG